MLIVRLGDSVYANSGRDNFLLMLSSCDRSIVKKLKVLTDLFGRD